MLGFKRLSLTARILVPSLAISFLLLGGFGGMVINQRAKANEMALQSKIATMNNFLSQAGAGYIENYDTPALETFVKIVESDRDFSGLVFYGKDGKPVTPEFNNDSKRLDFIESPIARNRDRIGSLRLYYQGSHGMLAAGDQAWIFVVIGVLVVEAILGFAVYYIVRGSVTAFTAQFGALDETSSVLHSASETLESGNTALSSVFVEQAASIRTTVSTLDQMTATARNSQAKAQASATTALQTKELIFNIQDKVLVLVNSVGEVNEGNDKIVAEIRDSLNRLNEVVSIINEIDMKTKVINEIVFQTRLLSFNASVEAARAGEAGRGFAVVAEEVGSLAQLSGTSSQEIGSLLEKSTLRVQEIIKDMEAKVKRAIAAGEGRTQVSISVADECKQSISTMAEQIGQFTDAVGQIALAFGEQTSAVENVNQAIAEIHQASEQSLNRLQTSVVASGNLKERSIQLVKVVDNLEVEVFGRKSA